MRPLDIAVSYLQERTQEAKGLKVVWCPTSAMVADIMTKCLGMEVFERHQNALGIFEDDAVQKVQRICPTKTSARRPLEEDTGESSRNSGS